MPDALNHPVRRQILRILGDSGTAQNPGELIAAGLPELSVSAVGYHARVLEGAGMVSRADGMWARNRPTASLPPRPKIPRSSRCSNRRPTPT